MISYIKSWKKSRIVPWKNMKLWDKRRQEYAMTRCITRSVGYVRISLKKLSKMNYRDLVNAIAHEIIEILEF